MVSTSHDLEEVVGGAQGLLSHRGKAPKVLVDCSTVSADASAVVRRRDADAGGAMLAAPVSGNAKVVKAGRLSIVASGPKDAYAMAEPYLAAVGEGVSYVGDGELARDREDLPQRAARRGEPVAGRDHRARRARRRAAPRVPRLHQQERDGLDVHALQDAGHRQARLHDDVHAGAVAQGPRPRPRRGARARRADAARRRRRASSCRR
jgi:hypothetical protein